MGSLAKRLQKQRARTASKKALNSLRSVGRTPLFTLAKANGSPLLRNTKKNGEAVVVAWCFTTHDKAVTFCESLVEEYNEALMVVRVPANQFLGSLLHHLAQADIDFLLLNGDIELPMTTIGVRLINTEKWTDLLNKTRYPKMQGGNLLLATVVMDVLQAAEPASAVVVEISNYADLVRVLMGKKGRFPAPDLGIVWMLASSVKDGVVPVSLSLKLDGNTTLAIGPMFFTNYAHAMSWPRVLPESVAIHLVESKLHLVPYRGTGLLEEVNDNFPTVDGRRPDVFLLDGGCLPMTLAGAKYTDKLAYGEKKPERCFTALAEEDELELRKATVLLLARALGIHVTSAAPPEDPSIIVEKATITGAPPQ